MKRDPIVEGVRRNREKHAARFNYDLQAICEDLKREAQTLRDEGWRLVSLAEISENDTAGFENIYKKKRVLRKNVISSHISPSSV